MKKKFLLILAIIMVLTACGTLEQTVGHPTAGSPTLEPSPKTNGKVLLGVYPSGFIRYYGYEIEEFEDWMEPTGRKISIAGTFMDFEDPDLLRLVPAEMEAAWSRGYIPFVNLSAGNLDTAWSAEAIAAGELDPAIRIWARAFARWAGESEKKALIAPLQEMNGTWTSYGGDPEMFKQAFLHIKELFAEEGVGREDVSWVFAPNGWSERGHEFERYYPGDGEVDLVGFNSFNFGTCSPWPAWETYPEIYQPYLDRMREMAPDKPIVITSLGTVAQGGDKDQWLSETYQAFAAYPNLRAVIYFNREEFRDTLSGCDKHGDYRIYDPEEEIAYPGFLEGISHPGFVYYPPEGERMEALIFSP
mgnify:CR=1 FL=1